jgi:hypothetical protein
MLSNEKIDEMRRAFIAECVKRGYNANEALQYFEQRIMFEGWIL